MSELDELREVQTASREIFDGKIMHVFEDTVRLPDGNAATREYMRHIGAVCVIPVLENGDVLVERQYRYPVGQDEDRLLAAQRELREETGAEAGEWTSLGLFYPACAYSDEAIEMFLARGIRFGERHLDKDEFLNVARMPLAALLEAVMAGEVPDAKTQIAVLKAARLLGLR